MNIRSALEKITGKKAPKRKVGVQERKRLLRAAAKKTTKKAEKPVKPISTPKKSAAPAEDDKGKKTGSGYTRAIPGSQRRKLRKSEKAQVRKAKAGNRRNRMVKH